MAANEYGPFGDHLRSKLDRPYTADLIEAMREIALNGKVSGNDRRLFYRLETAGLARERPIECARLGPLAPRRKRNCVMDSVNFPFTSHLNQWGFV